MTIESPRLFLREFVDTDANDLFELDSNPQVMQYIGTPPATSPQQSAASIDRQKAYYALHPGLGIWPAFTRQERTFIGWFALKTLDKTAFIEIGYRLLPAFWGKGYATEMSRELIRYGFDKLQLTQIVGVIDPANLASRRVLQKVGLRYVKDDFFYGTAVHFFSTDRKEWSAESPV
jgi:[ribosomal protein S5]-alanine N-acetyltransferase